MRAPCSLLARQNKLLFSTITDCKLMNVAAPTRNLSSLLPRVTCPHCWEKSPPQHLLWVSEHTDLLGDFRLGPEQQRRFPATRFTVNGEALDSRGFPCHQLACPKCHLKIPRSMLELEPLFLSIFGAPASGKSYFLAAMTWELRRTLARRFRMNFADADPVMNQHLTEYEESVFARSDGDKVVPLANLIRKTEEQGDLYDNVQFGNQIVSYPQPFIFTLQPQADHIYSARSERLAKSICLYDNAGESFQPGKDSAAAPVTRHMAQSRALFFVFDPTQDARMQKLISQSGAPTPRGSMKTMRQEPILQEAASRIRRFAGLRPSERHRQPLIVILTKFDNWWKLLGDSVIPEPFRKVRVSNDNPAELEALDGEMVRLQSQQARNLLQQTSPEIIAAAEGFAEDVTYIPVTSVGWNVTIDHKSGQQSIKPADAAPHWVTIPFLYSLTRAIPGVIPAINLR